MCNRYYTYFMGYIINYNSLCSSLPVTKKKDHGIKVGYSTNYRLLHIEITTITRLYDDNKIGNWLGFGQSQLVKYKRVIDGKLS